MFYQSFYENISYLYVQDYITQVANAKLTNPAPCIVGSKSL